MSIAVSPGKQGSLCKKKLAIGHINKLWNLKAGFLLHTYTGVTSTFTRDVLNATAVTRLQDAYLVSNMLIPGAEVSIVSTSLPLFTGVPRVLMRSNYSTSWYSIVQEKHSEVTTLARLSQQQACNLHSSTA